MSDNPPQSLIQRPSIQDTLGRPQESPTGMSSIRLMSSKQLDMLRQKQGEHSEFHAFADAVVDAYVTHADNPMSLASVIQTQIDTLEAKIKEDEQSTIIFEKLKKKARKIEKMVFSWVIDGNHIGSLQVVFKCLAPFSGRLFLGMLNPVPLQALLPVKCFQAFLAVPASAFATPDPRHQMVADFQASMLRALKVLYLDFPMARRNRLEPALLSLMEPYSRYVLRMHNQAYYTKTVETPNSFSLFQTMGVVIDKFVLTNTLQPLSRAAEPMYLVLLDMMASAFAWGLFPLVDCNHLSTLLFMVTDYLGSLESQSLNDPKLLPEAKAKVFGDYLRARVLVAEILLNLLVMKADEDVVTCPPKKSVESTLEPSQLLTNVSLIFLGYLAATPELPPDVERPRELETYLYMLFECLDCPTHDLIGTSLSLIPPSRFRQPQLPEAPINVQPLITELQLMFTNYRLKEVKGTPFINRLKAFARHLSEFMDKRPLAVLAAVDANMPALILELLNFGGTVDEWDIALIESFDVLAILCKSSSSAQAAIFCHDCLRHLHGLFKRYPLLVTTFICDIFGEDKRVLRLSDHAFQALIDLYKQLWAQTQAEEVNSGKMKELLQAVLLATRLLDDLVESGHQRGRAPHSHSIVIATEAVTFVTSYCLPALFDKAAPVERVSLETPLGPPLEVTEFPDVWEAVNLTDVGELRYKAAYYTVKLFNKATKLVYPGSVYLAIKHASSSLDPEFHFDSLASICLRAEFLNMFSNFHMLHQDNLLFDRSAFRSDGKLNVEESFLPENAEEIGVRLKHEFAYLAQVTKEALSDAHLLGLKYYLLDALLPTCFAFLAGIKQRIAVDQPPELLASMVEHVAKLRSLIEDAEPAVVEIIGRPSGSSTVDKGASINSERSFASRSFSDAGETERMLRALKPRDSVTRLSRNTAIRYIPLKSPPEAEKRYKHSNIEYPSDIIEERTVPALGRLRDLTGTCMSKLREWFSSDPTHATIPERFIRYFVKDYGTPNEDTVREQADTNDQDQSTDFQARSPKDRIARLQRQFKQARRNTLANSATHPLISLITGGDNSRALNFNLAKLCVDLISSMSYSPSCHTRNPHINQGFLLMMTSLTRYLHSSERLRIELLKVLRQLHPKVFFDALLGLYYELLLFVFYKPFMDNTWRHAWVNFQTVTRFFTSLFENDFVELKELLAEHPSARLATSTDATTVVDELYGLTLTLVRKSRAWKNPSPVLLPSDRPELFPILFIQVRMLHELVSGTCINNQLRLHSCDSMLWMGFLGRTVDDVHSAFYHLQYAVLMYISAFIDSLDARILAHFASHLQVQVVFKYMIGLVGRLYLSNQTSAYQRLGQAQMRRGTVDPYGRSRIANPWLLIDSYKKDLRFSQHVTLQVAIQLYILCANMASQVKMWSIYLTSQEASARKWQEQSTPSQGPVILAFLLEVIAFIEVRSRSGGQALAKVNLRRVYFQVPPSTLFISNLIRHDFYSQMPIQSTASKHLYLYRKMAYLHRRSAHAMNLYQRFGLLSYLISREAFYYDQYVLIALVAAMTLTMFNYLVGDVETDTLTSHDPNGNFYIGCYAVVIAGYCLLRLLMWLLVYFPLRLQSLREMLASKGYLHPPLFTLRLRGLMRVLLFDRETNLYLFYIVCCLLGLFVDKVFYTLNWLMMIGVSQPLYYIVMSMGKNYDKVLVTFVLLVLVVYCYAVLLIKNFAPVIAEEIGGPANCRSLIGCFLNSLNTGLRPGGGIGDSLEIVSDLRHSYFLGVFFLDISYLVLVKLILLNIVAGIIIETFGELRDEASSRANNLFNYCIVCGLSRWEIEKREVPFESHIKEAHNIWRYQSYLTRLLELDKLSLVGVDLQVWGHYVRLSTNWFPKQEMLELGEAFRPASESETDKDIANMGVGTLEEIGQKFISQNHK